MNKKTIIIIVGIFLLILAGIFFASQKPNGFFNSAKTPALLSISPTGLPQNSVGIVLRVYGHNLTEKSVINWNGTAMTTDTKNVKLGYVTATIPASNFTNYGEYPITVTNGSGKASNAINFSVARTLDDLLKSQKQGSI